MKKYFSQFTFTKLAKYQMFSFNIILTLFLINLYFYKSRSDEQFYAGSGYLQHLSKFNYNEDILTRLIEFSLSLFNYEKNNSNNFSIEIWDCNKCTNSDAPLWNMSDIEIYEVKNTIIKNNYLDKDNFFLFNKYLYFANVYVTKNKKYKIVFYKRVLYFLSLPLLPTIIIFNLLNLLFIIVFISIPLYFYYNRIQKRIKSKIQVDTINSIRNLIKHSLDNQTNALNSSGNKSKIIERALHYNEQVQCLIEDSCITEINPEFFLKNLKIFSNISSDIIIAIKCFNFIYYNQKNLEHAINVLLDNANHKSVKCSKIEIRIKQNKKNTNFIIDISNNGLPINDIIRNKIFKGFSSKEDGHGNGLLNLKEMLKKSFSNIKLLKDNKTTFRMVLPCVQNSNCKINSDFIIYNTNTMEKEIKSKNLPIVVIIEDEKNFWTEWKNKMTDAQIIFFENPDYFFSHITKKRIKNELFLSKIDSIICDFNFGEYNLIESGFLNDIKRYKDDKFTGNILLSTCYGDEIIKRIPKNNLSDIKICLKKFPMTYKEIRRKISLSSGLKNV